MTFFWRKCSWDQMDQPGNSCNNLSWLSKPLLRLHPWSKLLLLCAQVLNAVSECIEKEGYSYVVEDDLQGQQAADHVHTSPRRR